MEKITADVSARSRCDVVHLYGHSHIRRLGTLLNNPAKLKKENEDRRAASRAPTRDMVKDFGLPATFCYYGDNNYTIRDIEQELKKPRNENRGLQRHLHWRP